MSLFPAVIDTCKTKQNKNIARPLDLDHQCPSLENHWVFAKFVVVGVYPLPPAIGWSPMFPLVQTYYETTSFILLYYRMYQFLHLLSHLPSSTETMVTCAPLMCNDNDVLVNTVIWQYYGE